MKKEGKNEVSEETEVISEMTEPNEKKKKPHILLWLFIIALLAGGAYYGYTKYQQYQKELSEQQRMMEEDQKKGEAIFVKLDENEREFFVGEVFEPMSLVLEYEGEISTNPKQVVIDQPGEYSVVYTVNYKSWYKDYLYKFTAIEKMVETPELVFEEGEITVEYGEDFKLEEHYSIGEYDTSLWQLTIEPETINTKKAGQNMITFTLHYIGETEGLENVPEDTVQILVVIVEEKEEKTTTSSKTSKFSFTVPSKTKTVYTGTSVSPSKYVSFKNKTSDWTISYNPETIDTSAAQTITITVTANNSKTGETLSKSYKIKIVEKPAACQWQIIDATGHYETEHVDGYWHEYDTRDTISIPYWWIRDEFGNYWEFDTLEDMRAKKSSLQSQGIAANYGESYHFETEITHHKDWVEPRDVEVRIVDVPMHQERICNGEVVEVRYYE